jgi:hypothetical protein
VSDLEADKSVTSQDQGMQTSSPTALIVDNAARSHSDGGNQTPAFFSKEDIEKP